MSKRLCSGKMPNGENCGSILNLKDQNTYRTKFNKQRNKYYCNRCYDRLNK